MKSFRTLLVFLLLALMMACVPPQSKKDRVEVPLPPGTLSATEVLGLFSGKTVESVLDSNGRTSLTYYDSNGELRQLQDGIRRAGSWRVRDDGRICLNFPEERERCRIIVKEGETYRKYIVKKDGNHERIITYTSFRPGNLVD